MSVDATAARVADRTSADARASAPRRVAPTHAAPPAWILPVIVVAGIGLRAWRTTTNGFTFDESYTAMVGRRPLGDLLAYLRHTDLHPPLDYLLRTPLARLGASDVLLRSPSVVFSSTALVLFAWWMRSRGWFGVIATALMAFSTFQVFYGGEARMYALLELLGIIAVVVGERWLIQPCHWQYWAIGAVVTIAVFDHVQGFLLAAGLFALAGVRRDVAAWGLRVAVCVGPVLWVPLWGPSFLDQRHLQGSSWMPRTSLPAVADTVSRQVLFADGVELLVFAAVVVGGVMLVRSDRVLGRLWIACAVVPFALAALAGFFEGLLFDRTLTIASWAPPLAIAWLLAGLVRRRQLLPVAVTICLVAVVLVDSLTFLGAKQWDYDVSVERLEHVAKSGDVIAVQPKLYGALVDWRIGVRGDMPTTHTKVAGLPHAFALALGTRDRSDRIWLLAPAGDRARVAGYSSCAPRWTDDVTQIVCLEPVGP